jgi:hypothetical protein
MFDVEHYQRSGPAPFWRKQTAAGLSSQAFDMIIESKIEFFKD